MSTYWAFTLSISNLKLWWIYTFELEKVRKLTLCWLAFFANSDLIVARYAHPFGFFSFPEIHLFRKMSKQMKLCIGRGVICEALLKYMHPANMANNTFPNATVKNFIKGLLVIHQEKRVVKRKEQLCIIFCHPQFENIEIYCVNQWVKMKQQCPSRHPFPEEGNYSAPNPVQKLQQRRSREGPPPGEWEIDKTFFHSRDRAEDILQLFQ